MKIKLLLIVLFLSASLFSQNKVEKFQILKVGSQYSAELIYKAFSNANMCGQFLTTKSNDIVLDDGSVVRFFSKKELFHTTELSEDCFLPDDTRWPNIKWSILPNGFVSKGYERLPSKSTFKSN
jgi:hypothetical protein